MVGSHDEKKERRTNEVVRLVVKKLMAGYQDNSIVMVDGDANSTMRSTLNKPITTDWEN